MVVEILDPRNAWQIDVTEEPVHTGRVLEARVGRTVCARWAWEYEADPHWRCTKGTSTGGSPYADVEDFAAAWFEILDTCYQRGWSLFSCPAEDKD